MSFVASTACEILAAASPCCLPVYAWAMSDALVPLHVEEPRKCVSSQLREEKNSHCNGRRYCSGGNAFVGSLLVR